MTPIHANAEWIFHVRGLRHKDVAAILDITPQEFSRRFRKVGFTPQQERRLARVLNCSRQWLFDPQPERTLLAQETEDAGAVRG